MLPLLIQQTRVHPIFKIEYKHFLSDLMKDFEEAHMVNEENGGNKRRGV